MNNAPEPLAARKRRVRDEYMSLDGSPDEDDAKDPIPRIRTYPVLKCRTRWTGGAVSHV
jgi:hypothetical protein